MTFSNFSFCGFFPYKKRLYLYYFEPEIKCKIKFRAIYIIKEKLNLIKYLLVIFFRSFSYSFLYTIFNSFKRIINLKVTSDQNFY